jgi:glycosyltransferase involved in cell wall biosynthesis
MNPRLSVLIPAFECHKTIQKAIESVLNTFDTEVIIAPDDGDESYINFARTDSKRVIVLEPSYYQGPGPSRNRAFAASKGEFITMLDCDDSFDRGALDEGLLLAQSSEHRIAFIRTVYKYEDTGQVCRELKTSGFLDFPKFTDFHGSIHALYHRSNWHPYTSHLISQDVLHDAKMLLKAGGKALLTKAPYFLTLQEKSITAKSSQSDFNREYYEILTSETDTNIQTLFNGKLRAGIAYANFLENGTRLSFHEFIATHYSDCNRNT